MSSFLLLFTHYTPATNIHSLFLRLPHQGAAAEEDHEDDEGLKPVVFHDQVAGLSQEPPGFPPARVDGNVTAFIFGHTS